MLRWHPVLCQNKNVISISRWETRFEQAQQVRVQKPWRKWKRTWSWRARCSTRRSGRWRRGSPSPLPCSSTPLWSSWTAARFCFLLQSESETRWAFPKKHKNAMSVKISASDAASIVSRLASAPGLRAWARSPGSWSPPPSTLSLFQTCSLAFLRPRWLLRQIHPLLHCLVCKSLIDHSDSWNTPMYNLNRWLSHKDSKILTKYLYSL